MLEFARSLVRRLADGPQPDGDDRRPWPRYPYDREAVVREPVGAAEALPARFLDVSQGGGRLLVRQPLEPGAVVQIDLPAAEGEPVTAVLASVVHVRPAAAGEWSAGCAFATPLGGDDLRRLGAEQAEPAEGDQRAWRFPARGQAVYWPPGKDHETRTASIHNVSPSGVALWLDHAEDPGALLHLVLRADAGQPAVTVLGCVVYRSDMGDGRWLAGCTFVRELADAELQRLE